MTYHAGLHFPGVTQEPHITCDGCGMRREVTDRDGLPRAWFLNKKAPPGWEQYEESNGVARHRCAACRKEKTA